MSQSKKSVADLLRRTKSRRGGARKSTRFAPSWSIPTGRLEDRVVLSTVTWTGGGSDALWSNANNWSGGTKPVDGDDLVFPASATSLVSFNDAKDDLDLEILAPTTFKSITIGSAGYSITGKPVTLTNELSATYATGTSTYGLPTTLAPTTSIQVASGGTLVESAQISGPYDLNLSGPGTLILRSAVPNSYSGNTRVSDLNLYLDNEPGQYSIPGGSLVIGDSDVESDSTRVFLSHNDQLADGVDVFIGYDSSLDFGFAHDEIDELAIYGGYLDTGSGTLTLEGDLQSYYGDIYGYLDLDNKNHVFNILSGEDSFIEAAIFNGGFEKTGPGTLFLQGDNDYEGDTVVSAGSLVIDDVNALPDKSKVIVNYGGSLYINAAIDRTVGTITLAGTGSGDEEYGEYALSMDEGSSISNNLILSGDASIGIDFDSHLSLTGLDYIGARRHQLNLEGPGFVEIAAVTNAPSRIVASEMTDVNIGVDMGSMPVLLEDGATLSGSGTVGYVTVTGGVVGDWVGYFGPGLVHPSGGGPVDYNHYGTFMDLTTSNLTLDDDSAFLITINDAQSFEKVRASNVSLSSSYLMVDSLAYNPVPGDSFKIIDADSILGQFAGLDDGDIFTSNGHQFRINYNSDSVVLTFVQATTATLSASALPGLAGQPITLTATVIAPLTIPTGFVDFYDGQDFLGSAAIDPATGKAALTISGMAAGSHTIIAEYVGAAGFDESDTPALSLPVFLMPSATALASSNVSSLVGRPVILSATVVSGPVAAGGLVSFFDGDTPLGSAAIDPATGVATLSVSTLSAGPHSITASYGGDATHATSSSTALVQQVSRAATSVVLASDNVSATAGQAVNLSATVSSFPTAAGGLVSFFDGATLLGTAAIDPATGVATLSVSTLATGPHAITAAYLGDAAHATSVSPGLAEQVAKATTTIVMASDDVAPAIGQALRLTATVHSSFGTPSGFVSFMSGGLNLGTVALDGSGVASLTLPGLPIGSYSIVAVYQGNPGQASSITPAFAQSVIPMASTVALNGSSGAILAGQTVTLTASVLNRDGAAGGTVWFMNGSTMMGSANLDAFGNATFTTAAMPAGSYALTAFYGGSADTAPRTSAAIDVNVAALTTIRGNVFLDLLATGTLAAGDPGIGGRTVFLDLDGDGLDEPGEPSATTDASGNFLLAGIAPGAYSLKLAGFPGDNPTGPSGEVVPLVVVYGQATATGNVGLQPTSTVAPNPANPDIFAGGTTANSAVVESMYRVILGRAADPSGLAGWTAALDGGQTPAQVAAQFYASPEYRTRIIESQYQTYLHRSVEPFGLDFWLDRMADGATEADVAAGILGSQEYSQLHATSSEFIQALYRDVLGREATAAEVANWVPILDQVKSRTAVAASIVGSTESHARQVNSFYYSTLSRRADAAGFSSYMTGLENKTLTLDQVGGLFFTSPEMHDRALASLTS